jgi:outer membrane protein TolC
MARFALCLLPAVLAGCHPHDLAPATVPAPPQLELTGRTAVVPDTTGVVPDPGVPSPRPTQYRKLTAEECRSLAIRHAPLAAALDSHPENTAARHHPEATARADLSRRVRGYAADEIRIRSAAEALELYYQLLAAEGQFDLLAQAHAELRKQLASAEKAQKAGAADRANADSLRRRLLDLDSQLAKLEAGIAVLNAGLAGRIGLAPAETLSIWPDDPLRVAGTAPDADHAARTALHYRPDLNLLRSLAAAESGGELARAVVEAANPLLGNLNPAGALAARLAAIKKEPTKAEARARQQVRELLGTRERQAEAEARAAVATLRGAVAAVAARAAEIKNLEARVEELAQRAAAGVAGAEAELVAARLDLFKLRGELIRAATEYQIADVQLRRATGTLVRE